MDPQRTGPGHNGNGLFPRSERSGSGRVMQFDKCITSVMGPECGGEHLLAALRRNPTEGAESLFECYHGKIFSLAMSILKDEREAEEATQDVFLKVFRKAHTFRGNSALYSWICRICVNTCLMRLRGKRRQKTVSIEEFLPVFTKDGMHASPVEDWSKEVGRKMLDKELGKVTKKFMEELPEANRVVFVLSDVEGFTYAETAKILGLSVPAVKSRLHRTRLYMREQLSRYLQEGRIG